MQDDQLFGKNLGAYRILSLLGQGGMARVYKAYDERLKRYVAIKTILPQSNDAREEFLQRFIQEAQLVANLQHRNIVTIYEFNETPAMVYLVMQYVAGGTLRDQLKDGQPLAPRRAALYALQMAHALHHAHQYGIVHRDVKPLNMLVSATNRSELLLSDFGIAKLFAHNTDVVSAADAPTNVNGDGALQHTKGMKGSLQYMAPEQCLVAPLDARTDIYALGVVLFEMLTGQPPFQGGEYALLYQHTHKPAPSVYEINPDVPASLAQITAQALEKAPEARYQSAREMALALESFLSPSSLAPTTYITPPSPVTSLPSPPHPVTSLPSPPYPVTRPRRKKRKKNLFISQSIAVLFTVLVLAFILLRTGSQPNTVKQVTQSPSPSCAAAQTTNTAQPFVESFQDNQRGWQQDAIDAITPKIAHNGYTLSIANTQNAYMLCPAPTSVGILPQNFTLAATIAQEQGGPDVYYGLAFHLKPTSQTGTVSAYVFAINAGGACAVFKYASDGKPVLLKGLSNLAFIHKNGANTLQVIARESQFSFKVNGSIVPLSGTDQGISDASYTGGQLGVFVSGPDTTFVVTSVWLNIP